jgi:acetyl/propionyl-CoA carboxylase alpha subunit
MNGDEKVVNIESKLRGWLKFHYEGTVTEISSVKNENGVIRFLLNWEPRKIIYSRLLNGEEIVDYHGIKVVFKRWDSLPDEPARMDEAGDTEHNDSRIVSPMYGKIVKINIREKEDVKQGDILLSIDSMKIENNILAPRDGKIDKIIVEEGEQVEVNKVLLTIE